MKSAGRERASAARTQAQQAAYEESPPAEKASPARPRSPAAGFMLKALPALACIAYFSVISYLGAQHPYGTYTTETDFYHFYAPDAEGIAQGQMPENTYQGPGYPLALAAAASLAGDLFTAGKWISIVSATLIGLFTFLLFNRLFGYRVGLAAQVTVFVSNIFPQFSIVATTDMFFLMLCLAALVVFTSERIGARWRVAAAALLSSIAYLTRYNGLFLIIACLIAIVALDLLAESMRERLKLAAMMLGLFFAVASPWLYLNYKHHGSPFYSTNYLNIATEFYPELANDNQFQEGTRQMSALFDSTWDVFSYSPARVVAHYPVNLWEVIGRSITGDLVSAWVGWLAVAGFALALIERRSKAVMFLLASVAVYFLILAFTHWEARYYLYILVMYAGLASYAAFRLLELAPARGLLKRAAFAAVSVALLVVMVSTSLALARKDLAKFLASHPAEVIMACQYFKSESVARSRVMARKPHLAYMCGQQWVYTPSVKSIDELKEWIRANPVDYVAIGAVEIARRPALAPLKDPESAPAWLRPVWMNESPLLILYRPQLD